MENECCRVRILQNTEEFSRKIVDIFKRMARVNNMFRPYGSLCQLRECVLSNDKGFGEAESVILCVLYFLDLSTIFIEIAVTHIVTFRSFSFLQIFILPATNFINTRFFCHLKL